MCVFHLTDKTDSRSGGNKAGLESNTLDFQADLHVVVDVDASALT